MIIILIYDYIIIYLIIINLKSYNMGKLTALDIRQKKRFKALVAEQELSMSEVVNKLIDRYIIKHEKK